MSIIAENDDALRVGPEGLELAAVRTLADDANQGPRPDELILTVFCWATLLSDARVDASVTNAADPISPISKRRVTIFLPNHTVSAAQARGRHATLSQCEHSEHEMLGDSD
jgi:hypothetical protein